MGKIVYCGTALKTISTASNLCKAGWLYMHGKVYQVSVIIAILTIQKTNATIVLQEVKKLVLPAEDTNLLARHSCIMHLYSAHYKYL